MPPRIGLIFALCAVASFGASPPAPRELVLLDGTRIRGIGLSFNQAGAVALRAGEATSLTFSWVEISPDCLSPDQQRQQESFVRGAINEAKSSAPAEAKQIIRQLAPLVARMDPAAQERLDWLDVQVLLSKPSLPNVDGAPRTLNSRFWLPNFAAFPPLETLKVEFPARWRRLVTALRGNALHWRTFLIVVVGGTAGLFAFSGLWGHTPTAAESSQRRIKLGVILGVCAASIMLVLSLSPLFPNLSLPAPFGDWSMLDIVVVLLLSWGLALRHPWAAGLLLLQFLLLLLRNIWISPEALAGRPVVLGVTVLCLVCLLGALRGTIDYQRS